MFANQDYSGQRLADRLLQAILVVFSVLGFAYGYYTRQMQDMVLLWAVGVVLACLVRRGRVAPPPPPLTTTTRLPSRRGPCSAATGWTASGCRGHPKWNSSVQC